MSLDDPISSQSAEELSSPPYIGSEDEFEETLPDEAEREELGDALYKCTGDSKRLVSPLLPFPEVLTFLHKEWRHSKRTSGGSVTESYRVFALRMEEPSMKEHLTEWQRQLRERMMKQRHNGKTIDDCQIKDQWIVDFQNQVDYVPGLSKGKRLLDVEAARQCLALGMEMKVAGNQAFADMNFDMALTRYTQGVELLDNVECRDATRLRDMNSLLDVLLTNQAVAALRTRSWRTAVSACSSCLRANAGNIKARLRRAEGRKMLGELELAQEDVTWLLSKCKPTAEEEEDRQEEERKLWRVARRDARKLSQDLQALRKAERATAQKMLAKANFATGRTGKAVSDSRATEGIEGDNQAPSFTPEKMAMLHAEHRRELKVTPENERLITEKTALAIQADLLQLYCSPEMQQELYTMRRAADFEDGRFVRRLRPYLLKQLGQKILGKWGFEASEEGHRAMERALGQHVATNGLVRENSKRLLELLIEGHVAE